MSDKTVQIAYLNGDYLPLEKAKISTQDRGFLFGDGVYEVIPVYQKQIFTLDAHIERLKHSLEATSILNPLTDNDWQKLLYKIVHLHPWQNQYLYIQVTRGVQLQRDHLPEPDLTPTLYIYSNELKPLASTIVENGISAITLEDIRWLRCDIKAITLLPNILLKMAAQQQGAQDAILIKPDGQVAEGTSNNVFILKDQTLFTPPNGTQILPGITRSVILKLAESHQIQFIEKPLSQKDLETADEIWLTSSTKNAVPVTQLNNQPVGNGRPGEIWQRFQCYFDREIQTFIEQTTH
ncbi:MAG: D-amino acid aminotransferase [Piscirickettsiaceae bacterium CG_4_9_14_3_um_filter_43_564]|nr:D-amino acid aminotransferase [Thiomicrospira sp.]OIP94043.1 MAG: D-amino acid aminotransferase [Thiomicrospira sp. CG2_30_44_34]PIQ05487.1 MAG: D-amino acid aminotransferase [Piscirickettsiaceae bacterium CG18_big_fil_WC_8_21_14_2_50_44_103]PIU39246.1 MAG: D-amino acid aminotransferase [Piscirickettsiaceae bacterium CG07_land_8_20_14_0_80_44_28]PIW58283.1 MAG: D-amino acid aminotransferase [Piscirickettsiaceae bacterium CG12_big_fil_rev_8_21_14_0_65_44_934]PIW77011.1 MAG: D-amino acid amin